jgi:hypothetical protein
LPHSGSWPGQDLKRFGVDRRRDQHAPKIRSPSSENADLSDGTGIDGTRICPDPVDRTRINADVFHGTRINADVFFTERGSTRIW